MNTVYSINFRREAFQRERMMTRRRAASLGLWVLYFGAIGVLLGLYGLNLASIQRRISLVERQAQRYRQTNTGGDWRPGRAEAAEVERHVESMQRWEARLARLPQLLPANARIASLQLNPENVSGTADVKLVIAGEMRGAAGQDRIQQVMAFVGALSRDSVFKSGYRNIRLVTTRATSSADGADFVIECR